MAVNYHYHIELLLRDFQRRGLKPEIVQTSGNPPRAMEIRVAKKISVHWDADSRSVWAEGPWPEIERLENYIHRRFNGRWRRRVRHAKKLMRFVAVGLIATSAIGICIPAVRNHLPSVKWPFGSPQKETAGSTPVEASTPSGKKTDDKPIETAANTP